ncbi:MAG: SgcJ/EcaC family oxidoreductase [Planctomycetaceae bacterium]|nr:SgcJ/EcaC family oxidoreductase [Planctomycetaceae bacterium]
MRMTLILSGAALLFGVICFGAYDDAREDEVVRKRAEKASTQPAAKAATKASESPSAKQTEKAGAKTSNQPAEKTPSIQPITAKRSADEEAIRQSDDSFVKAYGQGNAKSVAAHFTADAEFVDELGNVFQGRAAIEESMIEFFAENPGCKLEMNVDTVRFISPGIAIEDGTTTITRTEGEPTIESLYTAVHVKTDGKWLVASIRDHAPKNRRLHRSQLQQLEWLVGDWVDEGDDSLVVFSCPSVDSGNFLLRKFSIHVAGKEAMSGTQRIGWDPLTGKLRAWIFDSEGAYSDGLWHQAGDNWVLKSTGVTADGQTTSSTSIYTFVNDQTMTWQSVHHEIAGVQQPDSEVITIVRQAPVPVPVIAADRK